MMFLGLGGSPDKEKETKKKSESPEKASSEDDSPLAVTACAEKLAPKINVSASAVGVALKQGLLLQRERYLEYLKQREYNNRKRADTDSKTIASLQQTLEVLKSELGRIQEQRGAAVLQHEKAKYEFEERVSRSEVETSALREISAALTTELSQYRTRVRTLEQLELRRSNQGGNISSAQESHAASVKDGGSSIVSDRQTPDRQSTSSVEAAAPGLASPSKRADAAAADGINVAVSSTTASGSPAAMGQEREPSSGSADHPLNNKAASSAPFKGDSLQLATPRESSSASTGSFLSGFWGGWATSPRPSEIGGHHRAASAPTSLADAMPGLDTDEKRDSNQSNAAHAPTADTDSSGHMAGGITSEPVGCVSIHMHPPRHPEAAEALHRLQRQLAAVKEDKDDLEMCHRCEVESLKEIIKAMGTEVNQLKAEKRMLRQENNRLIEKVVAHSK